MAVVENRFVCDLSKPVQAQVLKGNVFSLDNLGSRLSVLIYDNGQPANISGSVTANCILPDGSTVNVNGSLTTENGGSKAYVDVPQSCLLLPGILKIAIKCTSSSVITTLAAIVANVYMTKTDNVITPSQQIITDWNAEISASLANQDAEISDLKSALTNIDDGFLNKFSKSYERIKVLSDYTQTGYYFGAVGATATLRTDAGTTAGWVKITVEPGEVYSVSMRGRYNVKAYVITDADGKVIALSSESNSSWTNTNANVTIPIGAKYMYCNSVIGNTNIIAPSVWKATALKPVDVNGMPLESVLNMVNDALNNAYTDITSKLSWTTGNYYVQGSMQYKAETNTNMAYMPVFKGEKYRISGYSYYDGRTVGVLDINRNVLSVYPSTSGIDLVDKQEITIAQDGYLTFTLLTTRSSYFKVERLIRTDNKENPLYGKKICLDGDSICYGYGYAGGYGGIIAAENNMTIQNLAVSGGTMATGTYEGSTPRHWICTSVNDLDTNGDYYIIEGGFNDIGNNVPANADQFTNAIDTTGNFDTTGTCGAMEQMCYTLITKFTGKKLGFIFPHRINEHAWNYPTAARRVLMKNVLTKYGIPYLDLAEVSGMDTTFTDIATAYTKDGDGIHPNESGYKTFYVDKIVSWMKTL